MIPGWFFGFTPPWKSIHGIFGHVEAWGCDAEGSWVFIDPRSTGIQVAVMFRYDDVQDVLTMLNERCSEILWLPQVSERFRFPVHGPMSCAAVCGSLVGIRALFPATLRRKLLAKGAEVVHGKAARREPGGSEGATA